MKILPRPLRRSRRSAFVGALALMLAASGCKSVPEKVPSWMWPPPVGVALLRGTVAHDGRNRSADPMVVYLIPVETVAPPDQPDQPIEPPVATARTLMPWGDVLSSLSREDRRAMIDAALHHSPMTVSVKSGFSARKVFV